MFIFLEHFYHINNIILVLLISLLATNILLNRIRIQAKIQEWRIRYLPL